MNGKKLMGELMEQVQHPLHLHIEPRNEGDIPWVMALNGIKNTAIILEVPHSLTMTIGTKRRKDAELGPLAVR